MKFFKKFTNNKIETNRYADISKKPDLESNLKIDDDITEDLKDGKVKKLEEMMKKAKQHVIEEISKLEFKTDEFFDDELFKSLDIFHNYISSFIPEYPTYYDNNGNINSKAFLDARNFLLNELPVSTDEIIYSSNTYSGVMNDNKINFDNGFTIDSDGNVFNADREIIFSVMDPGQRISSLDFLNKKITLKSGIRISMPDNFIEDYVEDENFLTMYKKKLDQIQDNENNFKFGINNNASESVYKSVNAKKDSKIKNDSIFGIIKGVPVYESEKELMHLDVENLFLGDVFPELEEGKKIDFIAQLKQFDKDYGNLGICNFKDIPYGELNSLLFWGGGEKGVKPLSSVNISSKDIIFRQDGTVVYTGENSTMRTHRAGCKSRSYKTGHVCMYSDNNKIGLRRGIIQYIYAFCNMFGLFNANIPPLIGYKKMKIFPGLCIGGLIEMFLCKWQEKLSKRINELFQCIPASMISDLNGSGFENETFPYGSTVDKLEDLDKIKSCKVGDRFVVNIVPASITGNKQNACGVFIYDPQNKYSLLYSWKYKDFRGKPFKVNSCNMTSKVQNIYENPIIEEILMNTNSLGEDSITRKLMALQYAYLKKEALLAIQDVDSSMSSLVDASIEQIMDNLQYQINNFLEMKNYHIKKAAQYEHRNLSIQERPDNKYEYVSKFLNHFEYLVSNKILRSIPLDKCERTLTLDNEDKHFRTEIKYYDFSGYNREEYLVPGIDNVSYYDCIMFSDFFIPKKEFDDVIKENIKFYESFGVDSNKFKNAQTISEMLDIINDETNAYGLMIENNLKYLEREMAYNGYESDAFEQMKKRCYYAIKNSKIFGSKSINK